MLVCPCGPLICKETGCPSKANPAALVFIDDEGELDSRSLTAPLGVSNTAVGGRLVGLPIGGGLCC